MWQTDLVPDSDLTFIQTSRKLRSLLRSVGLDLQSPGFQAAAAGWVLERALAAWLESVEPGRVISGSGTTIKTFLDALKKHGEVNGDQFQELEAVRETRNQGAHARWKDVSPESAALITRVAEKYIALVTAKVPSLSIVSLSKAEMDISYIPRPELPATRRGLSWLFSDGRIKNARRKLFILKVLVVAYLATWAAASGLTILFAAGWSIETIHSGDGKLQALSMALGAIGISALAYLALHYVSTKVLFPFAKAVNTGAAPATSAWTKDSIGVAIICDLHEPDQTTRLVRYDATCPLCMAPVTFALSDKDGPRRVIGRCTAARLEHVFSFDHRRQEGELITK